MPEKHGEASENAAGPTSSSGLQGSNGGRGQPPQGRARAWIVPAAIIVLVASGGAAISYLERPVNGPQGTGSFSASNSGSGPVDEALAQLADYTRSIGTEEPSSTGAAGKRLPDVNTMIERLAARLKTKPDDVKGWQMLGWSYFHTGHYEQAAAAYAKAVELDPSSAELKRSFEEAKAKASKGDDKGETSETASSSQTQAVGKGGDGSSVAKVAKSEAMSPHARDAAIRSMVDGLAARLERSPRDVEGWTRLMRSRVVLGEREVAVAAFRKALDVFKDDSTATNKVTAAAKELGLKAER
jgi:tetratricopeptide (TPR) repeat protein